MIRELGTYTCSGAESSINSRCRVEDPARHPRDPEIVHRVDNQAHTRVVGSVVSGIRDTARVPRRVSRQGYSCRVGFGCRIRCALWIWADVDGTFEQLAFVKHRTGAHERH
jgi:hypothetical protein